jgi:hypothetical protein
MRNKELAKQVRKELKKLYPNIKFSVTSDYLSVDVAIMEADIDFLSEDDRKNGVKDKSLNHFYLEDYYEKGSKQLEVVQKVFDLVTQNQRIITEDGDYGKVPNYYIHIKVGKWDKPFVLKS